MPNRNSFMIGNFGRSTCFLLLMMIPIGIFTIENGRVTILFVILRFPGIEQSKHDCIFWTIVNESNKDNVCIQYPEEPSLYAGCMRRWGTDSTLALHWCVNLFALWVYHSFERHSLHLCSSALVSFWTFINALMTAIETIALNILHMTFGQMCKFLFGFVEQMQNKWEILQKTKRK